MDQTLLALRAAGEPTRLRLLVILSQSELTVSEICRMLGQSQPRVSRHLKVLCDAGLLERTPEGAWVFYRLSNRGPAAELARRILEAIPTDDTTVMRDIERLDVIKAEHASAAAQYFARSAQDFERLRQLYFSNPEVEAAMLSAIDGGDVEDFIDLGTGAGRLLEVFAGHVNNGLGIDASREMLAIARSNLEAKGLAHCSVRHADITNLNLADASADAVTIHHVLHFLDDPYSVVASAARLLRDNGTLIIVDFARHEQEAFREEFAHRRLGFADSEIQRWCHEVGLDRVSIDHFASDPGAADAAIESEKQIKVPPVTLWVGRRSQSGKARKGNRANTQNNQAA